MMVSPTDRCCSFGAVALRVCECMCVLGKIDALLLSGYCLCINCRVLHSGVVVIYWVLNRNNERKQYWCDCMCVCVCASVCIQSLCGLHATKDKWEICIQESQLLHFTEETSRARMCLKCDKYDLFFGLNGNSCFWIKPREKQKPSHVHLTLNYLILFLSKCLLCSHFSREVRLEEL